MGRPWWLAWGQFLLQSGTVRFRKVFRPSWEGNPRPCRRVRRVRSHLVGFTKHRGRCEGPASRVPVLLNPRRTRLSRGEVSVFGRASRLNRPRLLSGVEAADHFRSTGTTRAKLNHHQPDQSTYHNLSYPGHVRFRPFPPSDPAPSQARPPAERSWLELNLAGPVWATLEVATVVGIVEW